MKKNYTIGETYPKIITAATASEILGLSRSFIYKMAMRREINYINYVDSIRFFEQDILEYLEQHKVSAIKKAKRKNNKRQE